MKPLRGGACLCAIALAAGLAGCGEHDQVVVYEQGQYQGKPDTKPWENESFAGDKAQWEASVKARNQNQNEYRRING